MLCHPGTSHNDDIGAVFVSKRLPNRRHAGEGIGTSFDIGDGKAEGAVAGATFMN